MGGLTRADVLRRGVLGGLTLGISGSIAALTASRAAAGEESRSDDQEADLALVRMSASSELLAIDCYSRALASRHLTNAERANLADLRRAQPPVRYQICVVKDSNHKAAARAFVKRVLGPIGRGNLSGALFTLPPKR